MSPDAGWDELHLLEEPAVELPRPLGCTYRCSSIRYMLFERVGWLTRT